jgi:hypothetical protein
LKNALAEKPVGSAYLVTYPLAPARNFLQRTPDRAAFAAENREYRLSTGGLGPRLYRGRTPDLIALSSHTACGISRRERHDAIDLSLPYVYCFLLLALGMVFLI